MVLGLSPYKRISNIWVDVFFSLDVEKSSVVVLKDFSPVRNYPRLAKITNMPYRALNIHMYAVAICKWTSTTYQLLTFSYAVKDRDLYKKQKKIIIILEYISLFIK